MIYLTEYFEEIREHIKQIDTLNTNFYSNYEWDIILACIDTMEDAQDGCWSQYSDNHLLEYDRYYGKLLQLRCAFLQPRLFFQNIYLYMDYSKPLYYNKTQLTIF